MKKKLTEKQIELLDLTLSLRVHKLQTIVAERQNHRPSQRDREAWIDEIADLRELHDILVMGK